MLQVTMLAALAITGAWLVGRLVGWMGEMRSRALEVVMLLEEVRAQLEELNLSVKWIDSSLPSRLKSRHDREVEEALEDYP